MTSDPNISVAQGGPYIVSGRWGEGWLSLRFPNTVQDALVSRRHIRRNRVHVASTVGLSAD